MIKLDIQEIIKILPHRYPFLLVDRVTELSETRAVGLKNVSYSEPFFQGHFPQKPVMPGVLMIEALAQLGGVLVLGKRGDQGRLAYLVGLNDVRFRRIVVPGDQLRLEAEVVKLKAKIGVVKASASVDGEEACSAEIMFTLAD
jgi:3-hydroxyacyl-[acyl-carrier-protein] dehydratase